MSPEVQQKLTQAEVAASTAETLAGQTSGEPISLVTAHIAVACATSAVAIATSELNDTQRELLALQQQPTP